MVTIDDFEALDIRVGEITEVEDFPEARKPSFKLHIDFGDEIGVKKSSVQIVENYSPLALQVSSEFHFCLGLRRRQKSTGRIGDQIELKPGVRLTIANLIQNPKHGNAPIAHSFPSLGISLTDIG